jgi:hypothetical protein
MEAPPPTIATPLPSAADAATPPPTVTPPPPSMARPIGAVPLYAAPAATTTTPQPRELRITVPSWPLLVAILTLVVAVTAVLLAAATGRLSGGGGAAADAVMPATVYALARVIPTTECIPVSAADIRAGTAVFGTIQLADIRRSLQHHLAHGGPNRTRLGGVCAQHLEQYRVCYCIANLAEDPNATRHEVELFNIRVIDNTPTQLMRVTERSVFCKYPYTTTNFEEISIRYLSASGVEHMRDLRGNAALVVQPLDLIQRGKGKCEDSNIEARLDRIEHRLDREVYLTAPPSEFPAIDATPQHPRLGRTP